MAKEALFLRRSGRRGLQPENVSSLYITSALQNTTQRTQIEADYEYEPSDGPDANDSSQPPGLTRLLEEAATAVAGGSAVASGCTAAGAGAPSGGRTAAAERDGPAAALLRYVRSLLFRPMARGRLGELLSLAEGERRWAGALQEVAGGRPGLGRFGRGREWGARRGLLEASAHESTDIASSLV
jgi:hypothetical protein